MALYKKAAAVSNDTVFLTYSDGAGNRAFQSSQPRPVSCRAIFMSREALRQAMALLEKSLVDSDGRFKIELHGAAASMSRKADPKKAVYMPFRIVVSLNGTKVVGTLGVPQPFLRLSPSRHRLLWYTSLCLAHRSKRSLTRWITW